MWNERAGGLNVPKIAAIVMTMVGSKSQQEATPDSASRMYIERAIGLAEQHAKLFAHEDPSDAFVITDDFHSAGRISGAECIPITELQVRKFHAVEGRRLQVNVFPPFQHLAAVGSRIPFSNDRSRRHLFLGHNGEKCSITAYRCPSILRDRKVVNLGAPSLFSRQPNRTPPHFHLV